MKKLVLLVADSNGSYPVPAVKGGAVSTLVEHLVQDNERVKLYDLTVISFFNVQAKKKANIYKNTHFIWIKVPKILTILDDLIFKFIKKFFKRKKALSYKSLLSLLYYIVKSRLVLKHSKFDNIIIENNIPLSLSLIGLTDLYRGK